MALTYMFSLLKQITQRKSKSSLFQFIQKTQFNFPNFQVINLLCNGSPPHSPFFIFHVLYLGHTIHCLPSMVFYVEPVVVLVNHRILRFLFLVPLENGHTPQDLITPPLSPPRMEFLLHVIENFGNIPNQSLSKFVGNVIENNKRSFLRTSCVMKFSTVGNSRKNNFQPKNQHNLCGYIVHANLPNKFKTVLKT